VPHDARQHILGEDHVRPAADPAVQDLFWQRPSKALLEVALGMKAGGGRPDDLHPAVKRQLLAVRLVNLEPRAVNGLLRVEDQAVEVEHQGADQPTKCSHHGADGLGSPWSCP
jgi:hypothetical protein